MIAVASLQSRRIALCSMAGAVALGPRLFAGDGPAAVNFREPRRNYKGVQRGGRTVRVEAPLQDQAPDLARRALDRLDKNVAKALAALPNHARASLDKLPFYLMYGPKARDGGKDNGLDYVRKGQPDHHKELDPRWSDSIVIYCADNYVKISDLWALKAIVHEFSHAYHLHNYADRQAEILRAYDLAMERGLYRGVKHNDGQKRDGYATTNHLEYFAELSCIYFARCNYAPVDRAELRKYDPVGCRMIETIWKVDEPLKSP
jgi:hypothetical protein